MCVCVPAGGDTLVPSPRGAAAVQLRHAGGPVERGLHLRRDVQEKVSAWSGGLWGSFWGSTSEGLTQNPQQAGRSFGNLMQNISLGLGKCSRRHSSSYWGVSLTRYLAPLLAPVRCAASSWLIEPLQRWRAACCGFGAG